MKTNAIVVTGATGNLGSKVANVLLQNNHEIRVTGRSEERLSPFQQKATLLIGDLEDPVFLDALLQDATAVFLVLPTLQKLTIEAFAEQFIAIAEKNKVSHVVNISNCTLTRFGQPTTLIAFERFLNRSEKLHIKHLRCANFFENLNWGIQTPYNADIRLPYISSYEIAAHAAAYLKNLDFDGHSVDELMGKQDYSMKEIAAIAGIEYQQIPARPEDALFFEAFNSGQYELVKRTPINTPISNEEIFSLSYFLKHDWKQRVEAIE